MGRDRRGVHLVRQSEQSTLGRGLGRYARGTTGGCAGGTTRALRVREPAATRLAFQRAAEGPSSCTRESACPVAKRVRLAAKRRVKCPRSAECGQRRGANIVDILQVNAYIVGIVTQNPLGEFEVLILLAVLRLGEDAHPPSVRTEIESRARRAVQRGAVYVTLDRLEAKGLLTSRLDPEPNGGRPRRIYRVSARGVRAVRRALGAVERMRIGLEPLLGEE
jgi:PadR family transcriptional regulator, regulatory protein PadR